MTEAGILVLTGAITVVACLVLLGLLYGTGAVLVAGLAVVAAGLALVGAEHLDLSR